MIFRSGKGPAESEVQGPTLNPTTSEYADIERLTTKLRQTVQVKIRTKKLRFHVSEQSNQQFSLNNEFGNVFVEGLGDEKDFGIVEGWALRLGGERDEDGSYFDKWMEITSTSRLLCT